MKRRKGLALLTTLVFLLTVFMPGSINAAPNTSVHLFLDGPATNVEVYMSVDGAPATPETMTAQGGHWTTHDYSGDSTVFVQYFVVDGETYVWNPIEDRDPEIVAGVEGVGTGTNKYEIELRAPATYTVTYDANGGSGAPTDSSSPYIAGATVTVLDDTGMSRANYHFTGWTTPSNSTVGDFSGTGSETFTMPAENVTLVAQWELDDKYTVTYDANGGTGAPTDGSSPYFAGETVTVKSDSGMSRANYHFTGWTTPSNSTVGDFSGTGSETFTMPAENVTLVAQWELDDKYTVTYDANGGTGAPTDGSSPYFAGETVTVKSDSGMSRANYHFTGWTTPSNSTVGDFSGTGSETFTMPAENVTLVAQWELDDKYTVTYDANGGTGAPTDGSSPYFAGETVTVKSDSGMSRANYHFTGWTTPSNSTVGDFSGTGSETFTMPAENVTLVAQWELDDKYTVTYDANGGTGAPTDGSSPYFAGETVTVKSDSGMSRTNYHFTGWATPGNSTVDDFSGTGSETFTMPAENVVLVAQWELDDKYTVTYDANGGTGAPTDSSSPYFAGETVTVKSDSGMSRTNYHFTGWATPGNSTVDDFNGTGSETFTMPAENVTLVAQWELDDKYTVTYDANGGTGAPTDGSSPYFAGETVTVKSDSGMSRANYHFTGWTTPSNSTVGDFSGTGSETFTMPAENVTLVAQWELDDKYTVTYDANGGTGAPTDGSSPYFAGETVTVKSDSGMSRTNYQFVGWRTPDNSTIGDFTGTGSETFTMPAENVTLVAEWAQDDQFIVTYDANGGSGAPTDSNLYYEDDTVTVKSDAGMTRANYHFTGWTTPGNSTVGDFAGTGSETFAMPAENVTLVAQWEMDDKYTVTYDANGGTGAPTDGSSPYFAGESVTVKSDSGMSRANYNFTGWTTPENSTVGDFAGTGSETFTMPAENVTLVAQWSAVETYTVTYAPGAHGTFSNVVHPGLYLGEVTPDAPATPGESGWIFNGWSPTPSFYVNGNATYVAQWRQAPPPPQYNPNISVTITPDATLVESGSDVTFTMVVTNTGDTVLYNVEVVNEDLDFSTTIPILYVGGSETFTVTKALEIGGTFTVTAEGKSPQVVAVSDTDVTAVEVFIIPPPPPPPPENPPTGAIPFDVYSVSGLLAMGAGIFALISRKKEEDEDED